MVVVDDVGGARSVSTPAVSALAVSLLAHGIPLLLIVILTMRVNPGTDLMKTAVSLSPHAVWIPEIGGQSSGVPSASRSPRIRQVSSADDSPTRTLQPSMISQSPAAMSDVPIATSIADLDAFAGIVSPFTSVASADGTMPGGGDRGDGDGTGPGGGTAG